MVYLEWEQLGWLPLIQTFVNTLPQSLAELKEYIKNLLIFFVDPSIQFILIHGKFGMQVPLLSIVASFLKLFSTYLHQYKGLERLKKSTEDDINNHILFSLIWSIGGILEEESRKKFSDYIKEMISGKNVVKKYALETENEWEPRSFIFKLQDPPTVFDVHWNPVSRQWKFWINTVKAFQVPKEKQFHELIIPTSETLCASQIIQ